MGSGLCAPLPGLKDPTETSHGDLMGKKKVRKAGFGVLFYHLIVGVVSPGREVFVVLFFEATHLSNAKGVCSPLANPLAEVMGVS